MRTAETHNVIISHRHIMHRTFQPWKHRRVVNFSSETARCVREEARVFLFFCAYLWILTGQSRAVESSMRGERRGEGTTVCSRSSTTFSDKKKKKYPKLKPAQAPPFKTESHSYSLQFCWTLAQTAPTCCWQNLPELWRGGGMSKTSWQRKWLLILG